MTTPAGLFESAIYDVNVDPDDKSRGHKTVCHQTTIPATDEHPSLLTRAVVPVRREKLSPAAGGVAAVDGSTVAYAYDTLRAAGSAAPATRPLLAQIGNLICEPSAETRPKNARQTVRVVVLPPDPDAHQSSVL